MSSGTEDEGRGATRRARTADNVWDRERSVGERQPDLAESTWSGCAHPVQRAGDTPGHGDTEERDGNLESEADEEARRRQEPRQLARVREPLEVLLAREPERGEKREESERAPPDAALLQRQPDEADRRQDGDDLRGVREVPVHRSRLGPGQRVRESVGGEDACGGHRGDESPRERPTRHLPG